MILLIFILICYGFCNVLIYGSIFNGFRVLLAKLGTGGYSIYKLFTCFICLGVWSGFLLSYCLIKINRYDLLPFTFIDNTFLTVFIHGMLASAGVWLIHSIQEALEGIRDLSQK